MKITLYSLQGRVILLEKQTSFKGTIVSITMSMVHFFFTFTSQKVCTLMQYASLFSRQLSEISILSLISLVKSTESTANFFDLIELIVFHLSDFFAFPRQMEFLWYILFLTGLQSQTFFLWFWLCSFLRCDILFWFCSFYNNIRLKVKKVPFQKKL